MRFLEKQQGGTTTPSIPSTHVEVSTVPPLVSTTPEPLTFWTRLYNKLKEIFTGFSPDNTNEGNNYSSSTFEPLETTKSQTTTEEFDNDSFFDQFEGFFGSLAKRFAKLYSQFGSQLTQTNSSLIFESNDLKLDLHEILESEVEVLLQKYEIAIDDVLVLENLKTSIVDALVTAWNSSMDIDDFPVESPEEIQEKILETLQELHVNDQVSMQNGTVATVKNDSAECDNCGLDLEVFQAQFLEILRKAERQSADKVPFSRESSSASDEEQLVEEKTASKGNSKGNDLFNQFMRRGRS